MLLSVSMYVSELEKKYAVSAFLNGDDAAVLGMPQLYDGLNVKDGGVYIADAGMLDSVRPGVAALFVCSAQTCVNVPEQMAGDVLLVACPLNELINSVLSVYDKYQQWEKQCNDIITCGRDAVKELLALAARTHGNMYHVMDAEFVTSALYYEGEPLPEYAYLGSEMPRHLARPVTPDVFEVLQKYFPDMKNKKKPKYHGDIIDTLDMPMHSGSLYIGMLSMIAYNRKFEKKDHAVVEMLGRYVEYVISRESRRSTGNMYYENLNNTFSQILDSKHVSQKNYCQAF